MISATLDELPTRLGRTTRGLPSTAMWMLALCGAVFAMLPGINELLAFGSATFLAVFGLIDHLYARTADRLLDRVLGHLGAAACTAAIVVLLVELAVSEPVSLALVVGCLVATGVLRLVFVWTRARHHRS